MGPWYAGHRGWWLTMMALGENCSLVAAAAAAVKRVANEETMADAFVISIMYILLYTHHTILVCFVVIHTYRTRCWLLSDR